MAPRMLLLLLLLPPSAGIPSIENGTFSSVGRSFSLDRGGIERGSPTGREEEEIKSVRRRRHPSLVEKEGLKEGGRLD